MGIQTTIPEEWNLILHPNYNYVCNHTDQNKYDGEWALKGGKLSTIAYCRLIDNGLTFDKYKNKWESKLQMVMSTDEFAQCLKNVKELSINVKLRSFQFTLLMYATVTNRELYRWKIIDSERCTFCRDHYETIPHLLFECTVVSRFWQMFTSWYECKTDTEIVLTKEKILLQMDKKISALECAILIAKQYIYSIRCADKELNFYNFRSHLVKLVQFEKYMALKNNTEKLFYKKWSLILS